MIGERIFWPAGCPPPTKMVAKEAAGYVDIMTAAPSWKSGGKPEGPLVLEKGGMTAASETGRRALK